MDTTRLRDAGIKATFPRLKILDIFYQRANQHMSAADVYRCLLYTSPSPRDVEESRMPSSA